MPPSKLAGVFASDQALLAAARAARAKGLSIRDAYTPYPVHGLDEAMGLKPSWLGKACFALGAAGLCGALGFQYWVSLFNWPMNIGGKPFSASPALVPVAFELTVLAAGVGTAVTLLVFRGLLPGRKPLAAELGATDDKFLLVLDGQPEDELREFYREQGAVGVAELGGGEK